MCPLRLILIFLSATLAGFFVLKNIKAQPDHLADHDDDASVDSFSSKDRSAIGSVFWTFVDMASGRYLWRHLTASDGKRSD